MTNSPRTALKATHIRLGLWLAFIAGAINAGGFLVLGYYTSHLTGIASSIGDSIALHQWEAALTAAGLILAFFFGAATTSLLVNFQRDTSPGTEYSRVLQWQAVLLLLLLVLSTDATQAVPPLQIIGFAMVLSFMMGLQNAMITKISGATIRTTHITGLVTDMGIEAGRHLYKAISRNENITLHTGKLLLFTGLTLAFIAGGVAGAMSFLTFGFQGLLPVAALLYYLSLTHARCDD